ncbi:CheR family methyltransferase [Flavobacterium sp. 3-210]
MINQNVSGQKTKENFPIIGIGASAGGLEAFKKILSAIPKNSGMSYIIIQHLSPDHPIGLAEILSQYAPIPVHEIVHDINLHPDTVYVIPENNLVKAYDGILKLEQRSRNERRNSTIDIFFESLAEIYKSFAVGVVLSGAAFDGTIGLKKIKENGGVTIVQDPETALFKGMPQNAIDADAADYILAPEFIPAKLIQIHKSYKINHGYSEEDHVSASDEDVLGQIFNTVLLRTGSDFRHYKQPTMRRRIARRMVIVQKDNLLDYYNYLRNNKDEQELLFNDLLIHVTYFFRDQNVYDKIYENVFPELFKNIYNNTIRLWIAGCATGEEAYSMAILLHEYITERGLKEIKIQIFASDISEKSITKARKGIYSAQDIQNMPAQKLQNYFTKRDGLYYVNKIIREKCIFAVHDFIKDPPFAKIDLVSCRNVLIYLDQSLQHKALGLFHYSLNENGFIVLGKSESASSLPDLFKNVEKQEKIYVKKFDINTELKKIKIEVPFNVKGAEIPDKIKFAEADFRKTAFDILFLKYTPASVIINEHLDIVYFHGDTGPYLLPSPGKPNFNVLKMARGAISFELRSAISDIKNGHKSIIRENISIPNQTYLVSFEVITIPKHKNHLMILFYQKPIKETSFDEVSSSKNEGLRMIELEEELQDLRVEFKRVAENQQMAFEELQASNEELLSSSEELQALNEELETSTEELQSYNEELLCVNDELLDRQEQLIAMRNYSESIINTIREPLLIIDKDFIIKSANPAFYKYFQTNEKETEGHSFFEIGNCQWDIPEFKEQIFKMNLEHHSVEDLRVSTDCKDIGQKIMMVNGRKIINSQPPGLILLALEDITDLVKTNEMLTDKNLELENYNNQLETFTSVASNDLQDPLRKIHMFSKRILEKEKEISETGRHNLERILFATANMSQLITDLIEYTKINFQQKEFKKTDLNALLKKINSNLKSEIVLKGAIINIAPLPKLNVIPSQMKQLFKNLIKNSLAYSRPDIIPEINIESSQPDEAEILELGGNPAITYVKICFTDNGIGFQQEYENKIFVPFYRLHNNDQYTGSGLGLAVSQKIVLNHRGFIKASGRINKGTVICVYLPQN